MTETHLVVAEREAGWWIVQVRGLDITTQARRVDDIEQHAREAIAVWLDADITEVAVTVERSTR